MATRLFNLTWLKTQTGRDLDSDVNSTTLAFGEKSDGTQGAFTFFQGIKNFFKGVTALGELTSSGKIPVLNTSTGAVNYVTVEGLSDVVSDLITTNTVEADNPAPVSSEAVNTAISYSPDVLGATCTSSASSQNKEIILTNWINNSLPSLLEINVAFTHGNTYGGTTVSSPTHPKLLVKNADGDTIGTFDICDSRGHFAGKGCWDDGDLICFKRSGNKMLMTNHDVREATSNYTIYSDGTIKHHIGKEEWSIGGVIRNTGSGWEQIDGAHTSENIDSITVDNNGNIKIEYGNSIPNADHVVTFSTTPDETLSGEGWLMGASVGLTSALISLYKLVTTSVKIIYNGSSWQHTAGTGYDPVNTITSSNNVIRITFKKSFTQLFDFSVTPLYEGISHFNTYGIRSEVGNNYIDVYPYNLSGTDVIDSSTRFWLGLSGKIKYNANEVISQNGNIWISGKMTRLN